MALSTDMKSKRENKRARREEIDKLTNWFMINLTWGVVCFILLGFIENLYGGGASVVSTSLGMKITGLVFALISIALFVLGKMGIIKNTKRTYNYSIFAGVLTLSSLWIGFFIPIRNFMISVAPALGALRSEWWYAWGFRYLIGAYLVAAFVYVTVKTALLSRNK